MIDIIISNTDKIVAISFLIFFSVITIFNVSLHEQNWIRTFSGSMTLVLLPIVTYSITSVISGNIALSLGMIGALSIVRFRNPVRSSFELSIFFYMISLGICAAVDLRWVLVLGVSVNIIIFAVYIVNNFLVSYFKKPIFLKSFAEGNSMNTLEVRSSKAINNLGDSPLLVSFSYENDEYNYRLASSNINLLKKLSSKYSDETDIKGVRFISG